MNSSSSVAVPFKSLFVLMLFCLFSNLVGEL